MLRCGLRAGVGCSYLDVLLNEGRCGRGGRGLGICDQSQACDVEHNDADPRDGERRASEAVLADANAAEPEGVHRRDDKGETVDAGDRCETRKQRVIDLGVAERVPGQAGDAGAG